MSGDESPDLRRVDPASGAELAFEPANDLERVMRDVATGRREETAFFATLYDSDLVIPQQLPAGVQPGQEIGPGDEVALPVTAVQGTRLLPAFSSDVQLEKAGNPQWNAFVRLATRTLQQMLPDDVWLTLNPGADLSTLLDPMQLRALPEAVSQSIARVPAGTEVTVGPADQLDLDQLAPVLAFCRRHHEVRAAYRALFGLEGPEGGARLAVGLLLEPDADRARMLQTIERELSPTMTTEMSLLVIDPARPGTIGGYMLERTEPFYVHGDPPA